MSALPQNQISQETQAGDPELEEPRDFEVLLLNDDFTTMEFVIEVLCRFFRKSEQQAEFLMMEVHQQGSAVCGIYSREIAESKVQQVINYARKHDHPLMCTLRPH